MNISSIKQHCINKQRIVSIILIFTLAVNISYASEILDTNHTSSPLQLLNPVLFQGKIHANNADDDDLIPGLIAITGYSDGNNPQIGTYSPVSGMNNKDIPFIINGTDFTDRATVTIEKGEITKSVIATRVTSSQLTCLLPITGLPIGAYNITVKNIDQTNTTKENAFRILPPAPVIASITPDCGNLTTVVTLRITGLNFAKGVQIRLANEDSNISGEIISLSGTTIIGTFQLVNAKPGAYNLTIADKNNYSDTKVNAFSVIAPETEPFLSAIFPTTGPNSGNLPVTIIGSNFRNPTVYLTQGLISKPALSMAGKRPTSIVLYVTLPLSGIPSGLYNITIKNADGKSWTAANIFSVTEQPVLSVKTNGSTRLPIIHKIELPKPSIGTEGEKQVSNAISEGGYKRV